MKSDVSSESDCSRTGGREARNNVPVDRKRSLSLLMTLGMMMANGARADARASRERIRRQLERTGAGPESH